jgi:hypothetical protein
VKQALPGRGASAAATARPPRMRLLLLLAAVVLVALALRACFFHENGYERAAREVTAALQHNDLATVQRYQNAETATEVNRERVGRAADTLAPLGNITGVKQTAVDGATRVYDFDLSFQHGKVHETIKFDPNQKIVRFHYDAPVKS